MESKRRIGIDCRMIKESGIGRYIDNVLLEISQTETNCEFFLFVLDRTDFKIKLNENFRLVEAPFLWHGFEEQTKFLRLINSYNLDLYHSPHPNMPYLYSRKFIITIHDLTMLKQKTGRASTYFYPVYFFKWLLFNFMLRLAVKKSQRIITVSEYVKNQIIWEFKVPAEKVHVIYNGVTDTIYKVRSKEKISNVKEKFKITKPFLFYVGNAYPHKNLERLILAFELFNQRGEYQLFLGGKQDYFYQRLKNDYKNFKNIIFSGQLSDEEVSVLYSTCEAFVYPSISEGFGIQIIEALKVGAKVICSNNSCFPEIAGKYAYYFNPFETEDMKKTLQEALKKPNKSQFSDVLGYLKKFNWKKSAQKHYELYQEN